MSLDLAQFTGTDNYYKHWTGKLLYTDGVRAMAEQAGAFWLIDLIASHQTPPVRQCGFQLSELTRNKTGNGAVVTMREDTDEPAQVTQRIEFTDFPEPTFKLYLIDGVLLLPSEY